MVEQPQTANRVLHQIADDPVRGEELGRGGDLVGAGLLVPLEAGEDLVLAFGDVELVEPADHLDVLAVLDREGLDRRGPHRAVGQQVAGHEQAREAAVGGEHEGHGPVPEGAVGGQDQPVGLALRVVAGQGSVEQAGDAFHLRRAGEDIGVELAAFGRRQHCRLAARSARLGRDDGRGRAPVGVHEAQGDDPVEPCVGLLLDDAPSPLPAPAVAGDGVLEFSDRTGGLDPCGRGRGERGHEPGLDLCDEPAAGRGREGFEFLRVDHSETCFPESMASCRMARSSSR